MTGFLAFFCNHNHTIITIKDATLMSQSFTSMDARTQYPIPIYSTEEDNDEYDLTELENDERLRLKLKDVPIYPEPEGDPSY